MTQSGISVVIPYFNGDPTRLAATLATVRAQTLPPAEVILVDDGSDPANRAALSPIAASAGAQVISQANAGPGAARNAGAAAAKGRYLAFLDCDDLWAPTKLERQMAAHETSAGDPLVMCRSETVAADGHRRGTHRFDEIGSLPVLAERMLGGGGPLHSFTSALLLSRAGFDRVGGFDETLRYREDHHFLLRAVRRLGLCVVPEVLSARLLHDRSYTAEAWQVPALVLLARQRRFAAAVARDGFEFDRGRFLIREALRIGRRKLRADQPAEAAEMACTALGASPLHRQAWLILAAALVSRAASPLWRLMAPAALRPDGT